MEGIKVCLLGGFEASLADGTSFVFDSDKDQALFVYLSMHVNHNLRRESLADLLWSEKSESAARHNLSQAIYALRQAYQKHCLPDPFKVTQHTVQFHNPDISGVDILDFDQLMCGCRCHAPHLQVDCTVCLECLERACAMYQGDFCAGFSVKNCERFEEWLRLQREVYSLKYLQALDWLIRGLNDRGEFEAALLYAYEWVFQDPYDERGQFAVISLLVQLRKHQKARQHYEDFCRKLAGEMGVAPSREMALRCEQLLVAG